MNEMIYTYDGSFDGLLSCIFDSYAHKEIPTAITCGEEPVLTLFPVRSIPTDSGHAARVLRRLHQLSPYGEELVRRGYLTCMDDREIRLYRLVAKLLREGPGFLRDFSDETLLALYDSMVEQISGEMPRTVERWHQPASMQAWEENVSKLRDTLAARRAYFKETLRTTFHLSDARMAELFPNG